MNAAQLFDKAYVEGFQLGYQAARSFAKRDLKHFASPNDGDWQDIHKWCKAQYGEDGYSWAGSTFAFKTEHDQFLFKMRW